MSLGAFFFPDEPRDFPGRRGLKITLRGVHVLFAGIFTASYLFEVTPDVRTTWFLCTLVSGLAILLLDLHESAAFLLQVRGIFVMIKLTVLAVFPALGEARFAVLCALMVLSVISSHAPGSIRHRVVLGQGRVKGARSHG